MAVDNACSMHGLNGYFGSSKRRRKAATVRRSLGHKVNFMPFATFFALSRFRGLFPCLANNMSELCQEPPRSVIRPPKPVSARAVDHRSSGAVRLRMPTGSPSLGRAPLLVLLSAAATRKSFAVMQILSKHDCPDRPGGGQHRSHGRVRAFDSGVIVSTTKMNRILKIDLENRVAHVEAGRAKHCS